MAYRIKRLAVVKGNNYDIGLVRSVLKRLIIAAVGEPVGRNANWSCVVTGRIDKGTVGQLSAPWIVRPGMTLNCIHIFIVTGNFLYWCVIRPVSQRFFIHSCIYLRILIISYLATFLGTNSVSVRHLQLIIWLLSPTTLKLVVVALVLSRLDYANSVLTSLPAYLVKRLQSMLNASARLIYGLRRFDHVSEALHWLHIPERVQFKLAVLVHRVLHGNAPEYLGQFTRLSEVPSRSSLRSASSTHLLVPPVCRSTVGARAFLVDEPALWNSLPADITSIDSLPVFRHRLKNYLFSHSYPGTFQ